MSEKRQVYHNGVIVMSFILSIVFLCLLPLVCGDSRAYRAAVAEHNVYLQEEASVSSNVLRNLELYRDLVELAAINEANIIVFPEFGLNPVEMKDRSQLEQVAERVPHVGVVPCVDMRDPAGKPPGMDILRQVSCMAKENSISVLVNMVDWVDCVSSGSASGLAGKPATDCPEDSKFLYNTNVVFNEEGAIAAKYYKSHEWFPLMPSYNQPATPDNATYAPAWGPEFGIFTCFDIMWQTPAVEIYIDDMHLSHFLYPVQQGEWGDKTLIPHWSKKHSTVLLSANLGDKAVHDVSGIFRNGKELNHKKLFLPPAERGAEKTGTDFEKLRAKENVKIALVEF